LTIKVQHSEKMSLEQIRAFLEASHEVRFVAKSRAQVYAWMTQTLRQHGYDRLGPEAKGLLRRYLAKMTGLSRAQITRLIANYGKHGEVRQAR
jgi:predicted DNA-binding transcriptional regulator AlpA